jgi:signal transduction histidine kinase
MAELQAILRQLPLCTGLPDADLERLCAMAQTETVAAGQVLMEEGSPADAAYLVLDGLFEVTTRSGERDLAIATCGTGALLGEISLLEQAPRTATVRAVVDSHLLEISQATLEQVVSQSPGAGLAILRTVTARLRNTEALLRQSEKMAALGTLAAGLAHELNNPAAAVKSSSAQLGEAVSDWLRLASGEPLPPADAVELQAELRRRSRHFEGARLGAVERSDRESDLQAWLEELGLERAWELAPALVGMGWTVPEMREAAQAAGGVRPAALVRWLAAGSTVYSLIAEIDHSAERMSEVVRAVKGYSYLGQAPVQLVDVHEGLENTLVILRHKLKQGITVHREYGSDLPRIEAYGSELNQVWTNLIDNAIDAMGGRGEIRIHTEAQPGEVVVEIGDDGPGIPAEVQGHIFDAFFTTKPPGVGTGLGLHLSYNIVVQQHRGQITFTSRPGETTFRVALPVRLTG